ncbi:transcriptional regulator [Sinomonas cellulolyticus]|uniref:Winged helix-turn-helix transcriptional regulator n=1 Tax=Sinomonas cellulolyticus TaxID=2801916 RepID=A0ABS1K6T9_9MICC|nr:MULTISPECIES: metalloregulator ArsR/SmtB family transcription factor [Sinomonas]MBL0707404.1 winged helix-turn-helix transcriptional regulator [Sinomonas cellulolyticus]GHG51089.1 transcriptional regulator [Sinomonas sp. KCTC 49339]
MPRQQKETPTDHVFAALGHPVRRDLLAALLDGAQTAQALADRYEMARPSVAEHLRVLRGVGLVQERQAGRNRYYSLTPEPLQLLRDWLEPYEQFWRGRLPRLAALLEKEQDHD